MQKTRLHLMEPANHNDMMYYF